MDTYVLVLVGKGLKTEVLDGNYPHVLNQGWTLVTDQLLRSENLKTCYKNNNNNNNKDPLVSLLQRKRCLQFALCCSSPVEKMLPEQLLNTLEWLSVSNMKQQLNNVLEQLQLKPNQSVKFENEEDVLDTSEEEDNGENEEDGDHADYMANQIHQLTDLLPMKGEAIVQVHWILPDCKNLNISNTVALFGALKRLQQCNNAHINIISNDINVQSCSFLDTWSQLLQFSVCPLDSPKLLDMSIWYGSLTYMGNQDGQLLYLPGFALTFENRNDRHLHHDLDDNRNILSSSDSPIMYFSDIQLLHFTSRNSIPLFLFLPYKLKLHLLSKDVYESKMFIQKLTSLCPKGLCLLVCLTLKSQSGETNSTTFEWWMETTLSLTEEQKTKDHSIKKSTAITDAVVQRLCVIDCDIDGEVWFYPLRQTEDIRGDLYEYLNGMTRGKQITESYDKDNLLSFQDLNDSLLEEHQQISLLHSQLIADEIPTRSKDDDSLTITSQDLYVIKQSLDSKSYPQKSSSALKTDFAHLELSHSLFDEKGPSPESSSSPSLWQERLWLMQQDPCRLQGRKKTPVVGVQEALSLSAKDILKCFRPDGKPIKTDLSPLKPVNKSVKDNYININTNEAAIQETLYPEALIKKFHGVEYCLDSCSSLSKDAQLSQTQSTVLKQETLSLSSELIPRAFPKKNKEKTASKKKALQNKDDGKEKLTQQSRPPKRKSPRQTTKRVKRKRNLSPENNKQEATTNSETSETAAKAKESRSQRHKRRLRLVVDKTLSDKGIGADHALYPSSSERLYSLIKSFLKDLKTSHGLNETMKELARSNVEQVVNFEKTRSQLQEKKKTASRNKTAKSQ